MTWRRKQRSLVTSRQVRRPQAAGGSSGDPSLNLCWPCPTSPKLRGTETTGRTYRPVQRPVWCLSIKKACRSGDRTLAPPPFTCPAPPMATRPPSSFCYPRVWDQKITRLRPGRIYKALVSLDSSGLLTSSPEPQHYLQGVAVTLFYRRRPGEVRRHVPEVTGPGPEP